MTSDDYEAREAARQAVVDALAKTCDGFVDLFGDEVILDGWFTAAQLRQIADIMDPRKFFARLWRVMHDAAQAPLGKRNG
jgi:hypothetical protein